MDEGAIRCDTQYHGKPSSIYPIARRYPYRNTTKAKCPFTPSAVRVSQDSEDSVGDIGEQVRRDASAVGDCLSRDASSCVLTAETEPEVAHIIPFSCCSMTGYFDTSFFWVFLRFWLGSTVAQTVWQYVGGWNVNRLENLVSIGAHCAYEVWSWKTDPRASGEKQTDCRTRQ